MTRASRDQDDLQHPASRIGAASAIFLSGLLFGPVLFGSVFAGLLTTRGFDRGLFASPFDPMHFARAVRSSAADRASPTLSCAGLAAFPDVAKSLKPLFDWLPTITKVAQKQFVPTISKAGPYQGTT